MAILYINNLDTDKKEKTKKKGGQKNKNVITKKIRA